MRVPLVRLAASLLFACGGGASTPTPCDPFGPSGRESSLGTVIAAGWHPDGTLYVVGRPGDAGERVFTSEGGTLWRRQISGCSSNSLPDGDQALLCSVDGGFTLKVELPRGGPARMALVRGGFQDRDFMIRPQDELLEMVGVEVVKRMPVRERVMMRIEYLATLQDGRRLVVLHPEWPGLLVEEVRVHFGTAERLEERRLRTFERQRDGGTTFVRFDVDGQEATAFFPSPLRMNGEPTLTLEGATMPLVVSTRDARSDGLTFFCR